MMGRSREEQSKLTTGFWAPEEDKKLREYMKTHGETGSWKGVPKAAGLNRSAKSCRMRWINYLRPGIKKGNISKDEEDFIIARYMDFGQRGRWSCIAAELGRGENEVKNYFHNKLKKQLTLKVKVPELHSEACTWNGINPTLPAETRSGLHLVSEHRTCNHEVEKKITPAQAEIPDPSFTLDQKGKWHSEAFTWNGISPTLPAETRSGLHLVSEHCTSNHEVEKKITPAQAEIPDPSFTSDQKGKWHSEAFTWNGINPTLPAQTRSGLHLVSGHCTSNHQVEKKITPAQAEIPDPSFTLDQEGKWHSEAFTWNGINPTLPAETRSGLHLVSEHCTSNHEVEKKITPAQAEIPDPSFTSDQKGKWHLEAFTWNGINPTLPAETRSGLHLVSEHCTSNHQVEKKITPAQAEIPDPSFTLDQKGKWHSEAFTWNGINPTLPAETRSGLPPQGADHFYYDPQFDNNHLEVHALLFPNPTVPAQTLSGLPLLGGDHFNNQIMEDPAQFLLSLPPQGSGPSNYQTMEGPAQSLLSLPRPGAYHFYNSPMEYSQFNSNHPEVHASLFPNVIPNALFPNPTLPTQTESGLPLLGDDHFNNQTMEDPAQSLLSLPAQGSGPSNYQVMEDPAQSLLNLPRPGAYHIYDPAPEYSQFNSNHPEVHASLFPNVIPNALSPNPTLPAQTLSGLPLQEAGHFQGAGPSNYQAIEDPAQSFVGLLPRGAGPFNCQPMDDPASLVEDLILGKVTWPSFYEDLASAVKE